MQAFIIPPPLFRFRSFFLPYFHVLGHLGNCTFFSALPPPPFFPACVCDKVKGGPPLPSLAHRVHTQRSEKHTHGKKRKGGPNKSLFISQPSHTQKSPMEALIFFPLDIAHRCMRRCIVGCNCCRCCCTDLRKEWGRDAAVAVSGWGWGGRGMGEAKTRFFCPFLLRSFLRRLHSTEASDQGREAKSRDFTRQFFLKKILGMNLQHCL